MKNVVIGLGSMGRRRIRLMQAMADAPEIVGINRFAERRAQVEGEFGIKTFATLAETIAEARPLHRPGKPRPRRDGMHRRRASRNRAGRDPVCGANFGGACGV